MRDDGQLSIILPVFLKLLCRKTFMHFATALPGDDLDFGLLGNVICKVFVREKYDFVDTQRLDDFDCVA